MAQCHSTLWLKIKLGQLVICSCGQLLDGGQSGDTVYLDSILDFLTIVFVIADSGPMVWPEYPGGVST